MNLLTDGWSQINEISNFFIHWNNRIQIPLSTYFNRLILNIPVNIFEYRYQRYYSNPIYICMMFIKIIMKLLIFLIIWAQYIFMVYELYLFILIASSRTCAMHYFAKLKVAKLSICISRTSTTLQHLFKIRNLLRLRCTISFLGRLCNVNIKAQ